ncbi:MAG: DUF1553 domain-containing protein [Saprospiraceae bacterium]|nr:DUF1553 domain-containing protein [Saprospiraceae bacterium]
MISAELRYGIFLAVLLVACEGLHQEEISFNNEIRPILNKHCLRCHGGVRANGNLSFLFEEDAFGETESGLQAIIPGSHRESQLYQRIVHEDPELRMPLDNKPLPPEDIKLIARWIDQGAKWEKHWAYVPPDESIVPPQTKISGVENPIDQFVFARLEESDLMPAPPADPATLMRRLYLDLTGLPPTVQQIDAFLADDDPGAYERLVDRLLSSAHFGERWASMWLDLARYADTKGYEKDSNRSIWKYRDWVINAFNSDKPYDKFSIEQLAGDLITPPSRDRLIATAFHRNSISNDEGGTDDEEFRVASVIERVATTYEVWQGTTMACVQCHSHPYDPFRQKDFYTSMAFFNNASDSDIYNEQPKFYHFDDHDTLEIKEIIRWINTRVDSTERVDFNSFLYQQREQLLYNLGHRVVEAEEFNQSSPLIELIWPDLDMLWQVQDSSWIRFDRVDLNNVEQIGFRTATPLDFAGSISIHLDDPKSEKIGEVKVTKTGSWDRWQGTKPAKNHLFKEFIARIKPVPGEHDVYFRFWIGDTYIQHLFYLDQIIYYEKQPARHKYGRELNEKLNALSSFSSLTTPIIQELPDERSRETFIYNRGSWLTPTAKVAAGLPGIFNEKDKSIEDRLAFAKWLVSTQNPLTSRVAVNRFWAQIFGTGLVETMEEFGSQGAEPSHPELLDWLAVHFSNDLKWRMKALIRLLVTSATYRQAAIADSIKLEIDPENRLLSRGTRTRLSAEQIRDQILAVSDLLDRKLGGPSVIFPELNIPESNIPGWADQSVNSRYRRTLYAFWVRTDPFPAMMTFDTPDRTICVSHRVRTNTPMQALNLLNDRTYFEASTAIANRILHDEDELSQQIELAYRMVMGRSITSTKLELLSTLYSDTINHLQAETPENVSDSDEEVKLKGLTMVANALLNLDEFVVKG